MNAAMHENFNCMSGHRKNRGSPMGPEKIGEIERLHDEDLLMRFYGTMGQAHCYGFLSSIPGFKKDTAKYCFQQALRHVHNLDSEQDIAQDLNYNHLWYVLFDTDSKAANIAYEKANDHIERNLQSYPKNQKQNRYFLQRLKMQAFYRRLLAGNTIPKTDYRSEELPEDADQWLKALVGKYLGAIAAEAGDRDIAARCFQDAISVLKENCGDNIIAFIHMTVLVEAYHSLQEEAYREAALKTFSRLNDKYFRVLRPWQQYLLCNSKYPALNYWY